MCWALAEGTFALGRQKGTYAIDGDSLKLRSGAGEFAYKFKVEAQALTLSGGDLRGERLPHRLAPRTVTRTPAT